LCEVRASDKRITCDEEFSDSEDEGDGGRRHQESFKHKRIRLDDKPDGKTAPVDKSVYCINSLHSHTRLCTVHRRFEFQKLVNGAGLQDSFQL